MIEEPMSKENQPSINFQYNEPNAKKNSCRHGTLRSYIIKL